MTDVYFSPIQLITVMIMTTIMVIDDENEERRLKRGSASQGKTVSTAYLEQDNIPQPS